MRYETAGDWETDHSASDFGVSVTVRDTGNPDYDFLLAIHELTEAYVASRSGITQMEVDDWDFAHLDSEDPGSIEGCPYIDAHGAGTDMEIAAAEVLGIDFLKYDKDIRGMMNGTDEEATGT